MPPDEQQWDDGDVLFARFLLAARHLLFAHAAAGQDVFGLLQAVRADIAVDPARLERVLVMVEAGCRHATDLFEGRPAWQWINPHLKPATGGML